MRRYTFSGEKDGPAILIFGAIHGNEVCGPRAIRKIVQELSTGIISMRRGSVTFVPVCNPEAYAARTRLVNVDLNRVFKRVKRPRTYEQRVANELAELIDQSDVFLDIHSTSSPSIPFTCLDHSTKRNAALTAALGAQVVILGWPDLYAGSSADTLSYAQKSGAANAIIECGQHGSARATATAYETIRRVLAFYRVTDAGKRPQLPHRPVYVRLTKLYRRPDQQSTLAKKWENFAALKKGEPIVIRGNSIRMRAPYDCMIVMPGQNTPTGQEWFYLGKQVAPPRPGVRR